MGQASEKGVVETCYVAVWISNPSSLRDKCSMTFLEDEGLALRCHSFIIIYSE